jgi:hypothetical protein
MNKPLTAAELRDAILLYITDHEMTDHDRVACARERVNIIAYLCHAIGITTEFFPALSVRLDFFQSECPCECWRSIAGQGEQTLAQLTDYTPCPSHRN